MINNMKTTNQIRKDQIFNNLIQQLKINKENLILDIYNQDKSLTVVEMSKITGFSRQGIYNALNKHNITPPVIKILSDSDIENIKIDSQFLSTAQAAKKYGVSRYNITKLELTFIKGKRVAGRTKRKLGQEAAFKDFIKDKEFITIKQACALFNKDCPKFKLSHQIGAIICRNDKIKINKNLKYSIIKSNIEDGLTYKESLSTNYFYVKPSMYNKIKQECLILEKR